MSKDNFKAFGYEEVKKHQEKYKEDFRTKKSAATYILRLIYLSEPEGPRSWLFSDPLP